MSNDTSGPFDATLYGRRGRLFRKAELLCLERVELVAVNGMVVTV